MPVKSQHPEEEFMFSIIAIFLCTFFRVILHPFNFAPVGAVAVFSGRTLPLKWAISTTLLALLLIPILLMYPN